MPERDLSQDLRSLQLRNDGLSRRAEDAENALGALTRGEIDSVALAGSASPVLLIAAQDALRRNEHLLRAIFDGAVDAMLLENDDACYVDANAAACVLFGLSRDGLIGHRFADLARSSDSDDPDPTGGPIHSDGRVRRRLLLRRPDGSRRLLLFLSRRSSRCRVCRPRR